MKESAEGITWSVGHENTNLISTSGDSFSEKQTTDTDTKDFKYEISSRITDIFGKIDTSY